MKRLPALISALFLSVSSSAAEIVFEPAGPADKKNVILISGEIAKGDYAKFTNIINKVPNNKSFMVLLDGPGGSLSEAIQIGLTISKLKYDTLAYKGICASACAYIWLAGERAIIDMDEDAKVGFHSPYYTDKFGNKKSDNTASAVLGAYLRDIGANYSVISYATSVDGNGIRWLTELHAKEIGLSAEFFRTKNKAISLNDLPPKTYNVTNGTLTVNLNDQNRWHGKGIFKGNNGDIEVVYFVNGIKNGPAIYNLPNGDSESSNYVNGVKQGPASYNFINGDKSSYAYVNGVKQGELKKYLVNGTVESWTVVDGNSKGQKWTRYDPEGRVIASGVFQ